MNEAILITVGPPVRPEDHARFDEIGAEEDARWLRWIREGLLERTRTVYFHTGDRMKQFAMVIAEGTAAQIEALMHSMPFFQLQSHYLTVFHNVSVERIRVLPELTA